MAQFHYRLQLLLERKEEAQKEAERQLQRREQELEKQIAELQALQRREKELIEKRERLRRELMNKPEDGSELTAHELQRRSEYIKVMGVEIEDARKDIVVQRGVVEKCELRVEEAKKTLEEAKREVEVLTKHRTKQQERFAREEQAKEDLELDEIGNVLYTTRRRTS